MGLPTSFADHTNARITAAPRLRAVIAAGRNFSAGSDDGFVAQRFDFAQLDADTLRLSGPLLAPFRGWGRGHPVTLRFEHQGRALQGYARLERLTDTQWELALPRMLMGPPAREPLPLPAPEARAGLTRDFGLLRDGELVGHVSGLRLFSRTWLSQHLLVKSGVHDAALRGQQLMTSSLEVGAAMADVEYVRALWGMTSRNAAHIQAASPERLLRGGLVYRSCFERMRAPLKSLPPPGPFRVREAGEADERAFFAFVSATEAPVKLLSDDLVPGELRLETLSRRFGAAGLSRSRALTVVEDEQGAPLGWALLQAMSAGLSWEELHTSFRLFVADSAGPRAPAVRRSLAAHAAHSFAALGRAEALCHAAPADLPVLTELGFVSHGAICEFGAHRAALSDFTRQLVSALTRMPQRETKRRAHR